jgi:aspartate/methionine/tyrosine aminotransferase
MYLWLQLPDCISHFGSMLFAEQLLKETGVVISPGLGFGSCGEGYIRMALVTHDNRFHDTLLRLKDFMKKHGKKTS